MKVNKIFCDAHSLVQEFVAETASKPQKSQIENCCILYGAVTTGTNWRFLTLRDKHAHIDRTEYYIKEIDRILGILAHPFQSP